MNWFYAAEGQQKGPVSDMEFTVLTREGVITADTLVWREGLPEWQALEVARPDLVVAAPGAPTIAGVAIPEQNKDLLVQQMREGVLPPGFGAVNPLGMRYAGFWIRLAAKLIDIILLYVVNTAVTLLVTGGAYFNMDPQKMEDPAAMWAYFGSMSLAFVLGMAIQIFYNGYMVAKWGATLGKMAVGLKVVRADGLPLTLGRSIGRAAADVLNGFACSLPYLMVAFDEPEKRSLQDHICGTRVIYK